jgi:hypothetical protein
MKQVDAIGPHGATVTILRRKPGSRFILRWTDPMTGKKVVKTTEYKVLTKAKAQALDKSKELLEARADGPTDGRATWREVLDHYETHHQPHHDGTRQEDVDRWTMAVWRAFLPPNQAVDDCETHQLTDFMLKRQRGELKVPGRKLKACGPTAPRLDLAWLRAAINRAKADGKRVTKNPVSTIKLPKAQRPQQPEATWPRYEALRPHCEGVGSQNILGGFLDLAVGLGWRVTALTCLHVTDVDLKLREGAPNGRILKREEFDKLGYRQYVPISNWLAPRIRELLKRRAALDVKSPWLFPKVSDPSQPWGREYPKERQQQAERKAGLEPIEGGDFHPWRRMWATMRKHLPLKDVAYAGCWDETTLLKHYQKSDELTVLSVMNAGLPDVEG